MPIDFPNSPTTNQVYSVGNRTWVYDGSVWVLRSASASAGSITSSELAANSVTSAKIVDDTIVNADINSAAAIALSKLASGSSAQILMANATGVPTYTTVSGDVTISNSGVVTIAANSVALGSDTTGDYVASLVAGTGVTLSNNSGENATPTIAIGQAVGVFDSPSFDAMTANTQLTVNGYMTVTAIREGITISATAATGTIPIDALNGTTYYTTNSSANFVVNLRWNSSVSLNTRLSIGQMTTTSFMVTNGSTAYYPTSVQVDGTTSGVTTRWQGGTAPSSGNANSVDMYTFTVVKTANATFSVFAAQTRFAQ